MPRFRILEHDYPFLHWDFLLEAGESLKTWRLLRPPVPEVQKWDLGESAPLEQKLLRSSLQCQIEAEALPDHRLIYLDYEGPVSGERGTVKHWEGGLYIPLLSQPDRWELRLEGERIQAFVSLYQLSASEDQQAEANQSASSQPDWRLFVVFDESVE